MTLTAITTSRPRPPRPIPNSGRSPNAWRRRAAAGSTGRRSSASIWSGGSIRSDCRGSPGAVPGHRWPVTGRRCSPAPTRPARPRWASSRWSRTGTWPGTPSSRRCCIRLAGAATIENIAAGYLNHGLGGDDQQTLAPIGSIRVRVSGLRGTVGRAEQDRRDLGEEIARATGLRVIVTAGVAVPGHDRAAAAGQFGRPQPQLTEAWTARAGSRCSCCGRPFRSHWRCSCSSSSSARCSCPARRWPGSAGAAPKSARCGPSWGRAGVHDHAGRGGGARRCGRLASVGVSALLITGLGLHVPLSRALFVFPVAVFLARWSPGWRRPGWRRGYRRQPLMPAGSGPAARRTPDRTVTGLAIAGRPGPRSQPDRRDRPGGRRGRPDRCYSQRTSRLRPRSGIAS